MDKMFHNAGALSKTRFHFVGGCRFLSLASYPHSNSIRQDSGLHRSKDASRYRLSQLQEHSRLYSQQTQPSTSLKARSIGLSVIGIHERSSVTTACRSQSSALSCEHSLSNQPKNQNTLLMSTNVIGQVRTRGEQRRQGNDYTRYNIIDLTWLAKFFFKILAGISVAWTVQELNDRTNVFEKNFPTASCSSNLSDRGSSTRCHSIDSVSENITKKTDSVIKNFPHERREQKKMGADKNEHGRISLSTAVAKAQELCQRRKDEVGSPGLVVCVSIDGKQIYAEGFGYADLENRISMMPCSVLRIASISKAITATIVAKAWEKGQIDIEKKIQDYVPSFPEKEFMGEKVEITIRQLLNHTSGIRHYKAKDDPVYALDKPIADLVEKGKEPSERLFFKSGPRKEVQKTVTTKDVKKDKKKEVSEMEREEYYLTKNFPTTLESLTIFDKDPLVAKPGTKFFYTTYGFSLLAAALETALKKPFTDTMIRTLRHMGLKETYLDQNDPIIYNRARYYVKNEQGLIVNAPYVDLSYKWAGGGLLSTAEDIVKFGNVLLYSSQHMDKDPGLPGFLKSSTVWNFWDPQHKKGDLHMYGLGFELTPAKEHYGMCEHHSFGAGHTGAAVGVSSALFILPRRHMTMERFSTRGNNSKDSSKDFDGSPRKSVKSSTELNTQKAKNLVRGGDGRGLNPSYSRTGSELPQGVVVAIFVNMISVSVRDTADKIARIFEDVDLSL